MEKKKARILAGIVVACGILAWVLFIISFRDDKTESKAGSGDITQLAAEEPSSTPAPTVTEPEPTPTELPDKDVFYTDEDGFVTVTANELRIRAEANLDCAVYELVLQGTTFPWDREHSTDEWVAIWYTDGSIAYVYREFVSIEENEYQNPHGTQTITPEPTEELAGTPTEAVTITTEPSAAPTAELTAEPTKKPTAELTKEPTKKPTATPTKKPTATPTKKPTATPTKKPTAAPTKKPTAAPTKKPTATPTKKPTAEPTNKPTAEPTKAPTATSKPEATPTAAPTAVPAETIPRDISNEDLLTILIITEAGNNYDEMVGCGRVVWNRMQKTGDSMYDVIHAYKQFSVVANGRLYKAYTYMVDGVRGTYSSSQWTNARKAAKDVLANGSGDFYYLFFRLTSDYWESYYADNVVIGTTIFHTGVKKK